MVVFFLFADLQTCRFTYLYIYLEENQMKKFSIASFLLIVFCLFSVGMVIGQGATPDEDAEERYKSAIVFHEIKYYDQAISQLKKIVEDHPDSKWVDDARYMIGYFYLYDKKEFKNAIGAYQDFLKGHPNHNYAMKAQVEIGNSYYFQKDYVRAIDAYRKVIRDYTTTGAGRADLFYRIGNSYLWLRNYESAINEYKKIISDYGDLPLAASAQFQIARAYSDSGDSSKAKEAYAEVIINFPRNPLGASAERVLELLGGREDEAGVSEEGSDESSGGVSGDGGEVVENQ